MAMTDQTRVTSIIQSILTGTAWPSTVTSPVKILLGTTTPTNTSNMTELTGTGYVAHGTAITWGAVSAGQVTGPTAAITWTNSSGGTWSITGLEIWDSTGTTNRWMFGTWTGAPVSVANGNSFQIATNAITVNATGW